MCFAGIFPSAIQSQTWEGGSGSREPQCPRGSALALSENGDSGLPSRRLLEGFQHSPGYGVLANSCTLGGWCVEPPRCSCFPQDLFFLKVVVLGSPLECQRQKYSWVDRSLGFLIFQVQLGQQCFFRIRKVVLLR